MPSYQNAVPPSPLSPGDVGFSFNNETFPSSAQAGSQFALPSYGGQPDTARLCVGRQPSARRRRS